MRLSDYHAKYFAYELTKRPCNHLMGASRAPAIAKLDEASNFRSTRVISERWLLGRAWRLSRHRYSETAEEWTEDAPETEPLSDADRAALVQEIADLESFRNLAVSIQHNAKGKALIIALDRAFAEADRLGAARKAMVFTESRRTQQYLLRVLADSPYADGVVHPSRHPP